MKIKLYKWQNDSLMMKGENNDCNQVGNGNYQGLGYLHLNGLIHSIFYTKYP